MVLKLKKMEKNFDVFSSYTMGKMKKVLPTSVIRNMKSHIIGDAKQVRWTNWTDQVTFLRMAVFPFIVSQVVRNSIAAANARRKRTVEFYDIKSAAKMMVGGATRHQNTRSLKSCKKLLSTWEDRNARQVREKWVQKGFHNKKEDIFRQNTECNELDESRFHRFFSEQVAGEFIDMCTRTNGTELGYMLMGINPNFPLFKQSHVRSFRKSLEAVKVPSVAGQNQLKLKSRVKNKDIKGEYLIQELALDLSQELPSTSKRINVLQAMMSVDPEVRSIVKALVLKINKSVDLQVKVSEKQPSSSAQTAEDKAKLKLEHNRLRVKCMNSSVDLYNAMKVLQGELDKNIVRITTDYKKLKGKNEYPIVNLKDTGYRISKVNILPKMSVDKYASLNAQALVENMLKQFIIDARDKSLLRTRIPSKKALEKRSVTSKSKMIPSNVRLSEAMMAMADMRDMSYPDYISFFSSKLSYEKAKDAPYLAENDDDSQEEQATQYKTEGDDQAATEPDFRSSTLYSSSRPDDFSQSDSEDWYSYVGNDSD